MTSANTRLFPRLIFYIQIAHIMFKCTIFKTTCVKGWQSVNPFIIHLIKFYVREIQTKNSVYCDSSDVLIAKAHGSPKKQGYSYAKEK